MILIDILIDQCFNIISLFGLFVIGICSDVFIMYKEKRLGAS